MRVVEFAAVGPAPFCAMLLSDMGADVLRIRRVQASDAGLPIDPHFDLLSRGRPSVAVDLKTGEGRAAARRLVATADALVEGFRPGVMERLGLGPEECLALNPRLIYGRVTGWGQQGPLAQVAGHDIDYIALSGALDLIGPKDGPPIPPLNLIGDFGGGALYLAFGVVCALLERERSGLGQVVDAAMVDGAASLLTFIYAQIAAGDWHLQRGSNTVDGGAPWYGVYQTADGRFVAVGALEDRFYAELLRLLNLDPQSLPDRRDRRRWPLLRARIAERFKTKTRNEWCQILEGTDACFAPVLSPREAPTHPHNRARGTFVEIDGVLQPGPAPRFSRTIPTVAFGSALPDHDGASALAEWGFTAEEIIALQNARALG